MKISLITATWNSAESLPHTIRSITEQTLDRDQFEWVVVDGGSSDNTLGVIGDSNLKPDRLVSEPDRGIYDALNKGVNLASGEIIGFLHADDFLAGPSVLQTVWDTFNMQSTEGVYGDLQYVRKTGDGFSVVRHWSSGPYEHRRLKWGWMPPHPSLYLKKEVYEKAVLSNGEYFDTEFSCAADYDFMTRILSVHNVKPAYIPEVFVKMQIGGVSNRNLKHIVQKSKEDWQVIRRNKVGHLHTLAWKNLGKLGQFLAR